MRLFNRDVRVRLRSPRSDLSREVGGGPARDSIRVTFRVAHMGDATPPKASIQVYNPGPTFRGLASNENVEIRLFAGYDPPGSRLIFVGRPVRGGVRDIVQGADRILQFDAVDGGQSLARVSLNLRFLAGTTFNEALERVIAETSLGRGQIATIPGTFPQDTPLSGRPERIIANLAERINAQWFIRDGAVYVVPRGGSTPEQAPLVSDARGNLIGTPQQTFWGWNFTALLDASFRPHRRVALEYRGNRQLFTIRDAMFVGDSGYSNTFHTQITTRFGPGGQVT